MKSLVEYERLSNILNLLVLKSDLFKKTLSTFQTSDIGHNNSQDG